MYKDTSGCILCGSDKNEKKYYPVRSGSLVKCLNCDFYYVNPRRMDSINAVISGNTSDKLYKAKGLNARGRIIEVFHILNLINEFRKEKGTILDIGCYDGLFLSEAFKTGWKCQGVEPLKGAANYAKDHYKLNVLDCTLEQAHFENNSLDVITLLATLEHTPNPIDTLKEARRIQKIDGLLVISVPVIPVYLSIIKSRWRHFIGDHYFFFTDTSMDKILNKTGYRLIYKSYIGKSVDLDVITARLSDEWQPNNLGKTGKLIRSIVSNTGLSKVRFPINLFDSKVYIAKAT